MVRLRLPYGLPVIGALGAACGEPKEAQDPADLLYEDMEYRRPFEEAARAPAHGPVPDEAPATREQCKAAHRRIETLGIELATAAETDPERRQRQQQALLESPEVRDRINGNVEDCLDRRVSAREAACIAAVRSEAEIDGCLR